MFFLKCLFIEIIEYTPYNYFSYITKPLSQWGEILLCNKLLNICQFFYWNYKLRIENL